MEKLEFIVQSVSDLKSTGHKTKKRLGSTMVNVATVGSSGQQNDENPGGTGNRMPDPCPTCGMFCHPPPEGCKMVSNGKFIARNVANMRGVIFKPQGGGKWVLNNNFVGRFRRHGLGHLKISSQQEQGKVIDEINQAIKTMYEQSQGNNNNAAVVNSAVATSKVNKSSDDQTQKKKRKKKKKLQKQVVEEDFSDEEETEGIEGGDSDESHFD